MTIQEFKNISIKTLKDSPSASLDTNVLLEHCLKQNKTWILVHSEKELSAEQFSWLTEAVAKRKTGLPVAYITGHKEFYGYDFTVSPDVLIPKPDTEILVEKAIDEIITKIEFQPEIVLSVCDMCAGSGCIGISVLKNLIEEFKIPSGQLPKFTIADISEKALDIAKQNAKKLLPPAEFEELRFIQTDLFSEVPFTFDLILTNPPYIPAKMVTALLKDGRNEPRLALDGDIGLFGVPTEENDGLGIIRRLVPESYGHLAYNGVLLMETGEYNAAATKIIFEQNKFRCTKIFKDLEGQDRNVYGIR